MEEVVKQVACLSPGTEDKFKIIALLTEKGELSFSQIMKELKLGKSTLYNYLSDLVEGGILRKRVERKPGRRAVSYYSPDSFMIYLSPRCILGMVKGEKEPLFTTELINSEDITIIDDLGNKTKFHPSILIKDLLDAGIRVEDALDVATYVRENLFSGATTEDIARLAEKRLRQKDRELAEKFRWFLRGKVLVRTIDGKIEEWDRDRLMQEMAKLWKGIEKKSGEILILAKHAERCIKRQEIQGPLDENYIKDVLKMALRR